MKVTSLFPLAAVLVGAEQSPTGTVENLSSSRVAAEPNLPIE